MYCETCDDRQAIRWPVSDTAWEVDDCPDCVGFVPDPDTDHDYADGSLERAEAAYEATIYGGAL